MPTIDDVREFWNSNPLWTGEAKDQPGSREFFESHRRACIQDGMGGRMDERCFPAKGKVLDLGCGTGFWLVEFTERGFTDLTGADLSARSLDIARQRCALYGINAELVEANAEALPFADASFDHVNCAGVVHHTVNPRRAIEEIHRVLKPGGTAAVSVYYRNVVLRNLGFFRPIISVLAGLGAKLRGRGREGIYSTPDADEIVRLYDGRDNPIGLAYDRAQFLALLDGFAVDDVFYHFFPARSLPFRIPRWLHRILDRRLPFMIYATVRKPRDVTADPAVEAAKTPEELLRIDIA